MVQRVLHRNLRSSDLTKGKNTDKWTLRVFILYDVGFGYYFVIFDKQKQCFNQAQDKIFLPDL